MEDFYTEELNKYEFRIKVNYYIRALVLVIIVIF